MLTMRVAGTTNAGKLAGALAASLREQGGLAALQAVGPAAVNQAVKAVALARGFLAPSGLDLTVVPVFVTPDKAEEGQEQLHSAVRLIVRLVPDETGHA